MAQAAKQLRKNKELDALAAQEQKEKEDEKNKKRNRSRDRRRKADVVQRWLVDQDSSVVPGRTARGIWRFDDRSAPRQVLHDVCVSPA
ncbi:ankyrin-3-like [Conger conger]|uniref:ankyrin-3-like n=1 Tax=Conger conger TaxID=82655 RepID=UPI002A59BD2D|nr:ankyrin-3-like [Conger conger]